MQFRAKEVKDDMKHCALCNEAIETVDIEFDQIRVVAGEYWHLDCYAEYFELALEEA